MNSLTVFFKGFEKNYRRANYCQTASYVKQITVNVSLVCINCELKTSNLAVFFNIFFFLHATVTNMVISWRKLMGLASIVLA